MNEEILSVVDVPAGLMGRIIGKKGVAIRSLKESIKYDLCLCEHLMIPGVGYVFSMEIFMMYLLIMSSNFPIRFF